MSVILIKYSYSQAMNIFVEVLHRKLWGKNFFCNKTKSEAFLENHGHTFLHIGKTFQKQNSRKTLFDLGQLKLLEVSRVLESIQGQFAWKTFNSFLWQIFIDNIWSMNLQGNSKFCLVVGNIMPQMKQFKNICYVLVIP